MSGEEEQNKTRVVEAQFENSGTAQLIEALRALSAGEPPRPPRRTQRLYVAASVTTIGLVTALVWWGFSANTAPPRGTLTLEANQPNVEIEVDGESIGRAPLEIQLAPGAHVIEASSATARVRETVQIQAGARRVLELELELPDGVQPDLSLDSDALDRPPESEP